jgi:hypothetical protein
MVKQSGSMSFSMWSQSSNANAMTRQGVGVRVLGKVAALSFSRSDTKSGNAAIGLAKWRELDAANP